ncbi:hypothetical protein [Labrys monachus]|uniref:Secreted protein n=1 Tax=Labrys monachus TaxID=217067 RepID=A0ABU0FAI1_9HYPH|nr:hypothetical protein [Labrys monachus]MDQ0391628.1 hypothetical protein [Labrys monachus]
MDKRFHLRGGLVAALVIGALAVSSASASAATTGRSGNSPGGSSPGGSTSSGGHSGGDTSALVIVTGNCPPGIAAGRCGHRGPPVVRIRDRAVTGSHCDVYEWQHVILSDGTIVEDRSLPMRRACRIVQDED